MRPPAWLVRTGWPRRRRRGFTLVELLVVMAIIALLVSMLVPNLSRMMELARRTQCATNLKSLGDGWAAYWSAYSYRTPHMFNPLPTCSDCISQFNFMIWCGQNHTAPGQHPDWVNAGMLYKLKYVTVENVYICPTIVRSRPGPWFHPTRGGFAGIYINPWPVQHGPLSTMCYGTRRMKNYDEPSLANETSGNHRDPKDDHVMIWSAGLAGVAKPGGFSFMADSFHVPSVALRSHVPGINVLYLDGHVGFYRDAAGNVLYDNGIIGWGQEFNWLHDDVWMIVDGYHRPPVGSGNK